jgi:tetraacyldisaccharide 4'-kinase
MQRRCKGLLLSPCAWFYAIITSCRNTLYDEGYFSAYNSSLPVVSVGNLDVGGNGKTPLVIEICRILKAVNLRPAVVMRGYGGREVGPYIVQKHDTTSQVGDEALILREQLVDAPVVVARKRESGIRLLESRDDVDVIVLDDGLQHRSVARDLDIITHYLGTREAYDNFYKGHLLPLGSFREDRDRGLRRADAIVLASRSFKELVPDCEFENRLPIGLKVFYSHLTVREVRFGGSTGVVPIDRLRDKPVVGVCGLGNPNGFRETIDYISAGQVVGFYSYRDHHEFSAHEIDEIINRYPHETILSTAKDMIKIKNFIHGNEQVASRWGEVIIETRVNPLNQFKDMVLEKIGHSHKLTTK